MGFHYNYFNTQTTFIISHHSNHGQEKTIFTMASTTNKSDLSFATTTVVVKKLISHGHHNNHIRFQALLLLPLFTKNPSLLNALVREKQGKATIRLS